MARKNRLAFILASFFILSLSFNASAQQQVGVFVSPDSATSGSGYYVSIGGLFMRAHTSDPLGAVAFNNDSDEVLGCVENDQESPCLTKLDHATWGRDGGVRVAIGKNVPNSPWDIGMEFTYFATGDVKDIEGRGDFRVYPAFYDRDIDSQNQAADVRAETHMEVIYGDFMARYNVRFGDNFLLGLGGGVRVSVIENDRLFTATGYDCSGADILNDPRRTILQGCVVSQRSDFWGIGPRLAISVGWAATDRLSLFTNFGFSILMGEMDHRVDEHGDADFNDDRTMLQDVRGKGIPVIDSQIGVNYKDGNLSFQIGYELQNWFGLHDRTQTSISDDNDAAIFQDVSIEDVVFEGPYVKATLGF